MGEGGQNQGSKAGRSGSAPRDALLAGNFALARQLAQDVLKDPASPQNAKEDARQVLDATRVDRGPIIAGIIMLIVLALLFAYVLTRPHGG